LSKDASTGQRTVATNNDQCIDATLLHVLVSLLAAFRRFKFSTTGRL
jgi:hypothetical protein